MRFRSLTLACCLLAACGKPQPPAAPQAGAPPVASAGEPAASQSGDSDESFFDPKHYPNAVTGSFVDTTKLSASEIRYGLAPKRDPRVIYQDGVILMEHGDQAIREAKSDGMTFSFDAGAEHVAEFQPGKIIFATGRVVGRVGQITKEGGTVTIKLAPVQITEIVKQGTFRISSDFNPKQLLTYTAPDFPSTIDYSEQQPPTSDLDDLPAGEFLRANFIKTQAELPSLLGKDLSTKAYALATPSGPPLDIGKGLKVSPAIGADGGIGINLNYVKNGVIFNAYGQLVLPAPHINFLLDIDSSGVKTFGIELTGSFGVRLAIDAYSDTLRYVNANSVTQVPLDLSLPCPIAGLPLALSFHSSFQIDTTFSAKSSTITSKGEWLLNGKLFAGYRDHRLSFDLPKMTPTTSLVEHVTGVSVGINRVGGTVNIRPMIGLGGFGFNTGVYLGISFGGHIIKQASIARGDCHGADASAAYDSGVGYQLSGPLRVFINTVLSLFTTYQIEKDHSLIRGPNGPLFKTDEDVPKGCAGLSTASAAPSKPSDEPFLTAS